MNQNRKRIRSSHACVRTIKSVEHEQVLMKQLATGEPVEKQTRIEKRYIEKKKSSMSRRDQEKTDIYPVPT